MWQAELYSQTYGHEKPKQLYLIEGEWGVGRKGKPLSFREDSYISRNHALLVVETSSTQQQILWVKDLGSKFGTFINGKKVGKEKVQIKDGDQLVMGPYDQLGQHVLMKFTNEKFQILLSRIPKRRSVSVKAMAEKCGIAIVSQPSRNVSLCVTEEKLIPTVKVLWSLVYNQPIVTPSWLSALSEITDLMSFSLPDAKRYSPTDASQYFPNDLRCKLFTSVLMIFLNTSNAMYQMVPHLAGEVCLARDKMRDDTIKSARKKRYRVFVIEPSTEGDLSTEDQEFIARMQHNGTYILSESDLAGWMISMNEPELPEPVVAVKSPARIKKVTEPRISQKAPMEAEQVLQSQAEKKRIPTTVAKDKSKKIVSPKTSVVKESQSKGVVEEESSHKDDFPAFVFNEEPPLVVSNLIPATRAVVPNFSNSRYRNTSGRNNVKVFRKGNRNASGGGSVGELVPFAPDGFTPVESEHFCQMRDEYEDLEKQEIEAERLFTGRESRNNLSMPRKTKKARILRQLDMSIFT